MFTLDTSGTINENCGQLIAAVSPHRQVVSSRITNLNPNSSPPRFKADRTSSGDGYKWRKYGRKFLTFSRLNRDYYRCAHPGCPAKKHVEVMPDSGEIVTSGSTPHSHAPFAHAPGSSYKRGSPTEAPKKT